MRRGHRGNIRRHDKIGNSASSIPPSRGNCIGSTNTVFIEKPCAPNLTRDERSSENANENSNGDETTRVMCSTGECSWNRARNHATYHTFSWSEAITERPHKNTNKKRRKECNDISVRNVSGREIEIGFESDWRERWKRIQERKETMKPSHDRKKTLPCRQKGFYIRSVSLGK